MIAWALGAGALGTVAVGVWGFFQLKRAQGAEKDLGHEAAAHKLTRALVADLKRQFTQLQAEKEEERGRLESVVTQLKREAALAREEFHACVVDGPARGSIAAAFERMLETPVAGAGAGAASAVVPDGPAAGTPGHSANEG